MDRKYFDVLIIGAGISGISAARHLQLDCPDKSFAILEGRENIGGTWDYFKYPGLRSDSDMYTLGFRFRPWTGTKAIADGPSILNYLKDTVTEYGLMDKIHFQKRVKKAIWSSADALWTVEIEAPDDATSEIYTCNFLSVCSGYYNYDGGYEPHFEGQEKFKGRIVHPQKWTTDIDYENKKVVVIGSGATAVTLVPEIAKKATHVTMLQRSPTYVVSMPDEDKIATWMNKRLPSGLAYTVARWKNILFAIGSYNFSKKYPNFMRNFIMKNVKRGTRNAPGIEKHFSPSYNPWDQRLCLVPNGDLFKSIRSGKIEMVTDKIETFTEHGIQLHSGGHIDADIIVTATGLNVQLLGGMQVFVDDKKMEPSQTVSYKSMMFSNVPNMIMAFGYTNASWTLKIDLTNQYMCRLLNYMKKNGYRQAVPRQNDSTLQLLPFTDFSAGYLQRVMDQLPKQGSKKPWILKQNYFFDMMSIRYSNIKDKVLEFKK